jgi:hypothetical protein
MLLISINSFAGEKMTKESVLKEDSMVFSIDEATKMADYIYTLEQKNNKHIETIELYKQLVAIKDSKESTQEEYIKIKDEIILKYKEMQSLNDKRISQLERRDTIRKIETAVAFFAGVGFTTAIVIATK